jgi:hypothetical protein
MHRVLSHRNRRVIGLELKGKKEKQDVTTEAEDA